MNSQSKKILLELESSKGKNNPNWNISWATGEYISDIIKSHKLQNGLEIGGSTGFSAIFFASALIENKGKLTTTESSPKRIPTLKENIKKSQLNNINLLEGHAPEILGSTLDQQFDFVFLDATKYEYLSYIMYLLDNKLLKNKAIIIADNVSSHRDSLHDYISYVKNFPNMDSELVDIGTGLLVSNYNKQASGRK